MNQLRQPESSDGLIVTLNQMGYMLPNPEEYNQAFIEFSSTVHDLCLEIGAAYGVSTIPALAKGAHIVANDLSSQHLDILKSQIPESNLSRLVLKPGRFPEDLNFEDESFAGILASRILHFIQPELLQESVKKIFTWLKKGGKFFVLVSSPYSESYRSYLPLYQQKKQAGELWPGFLSDIKTYAPQHAKHIAEFINFFDQDDVRRLLEAAGFIIENLGYSSFKISDPKNIKSKGREHVGAIAIKP